MMRWIVGSSLQFRFIVIALGVAIMYFGMQRLQEMPIDVFPEFAPPKVEIQTIALGLSPSEVETLITVPLENVLSGVPGVSAMRSKSVPQLSSINLIFKPGINELAARQLVTERVAIATPSLPTWAAPPYVMPPKSSTSRVMKIGITSKDRSIMDLSMLAYWTIRAKLLGVPGVANVAIWGEQLKMLQVRIDPNRLAKYGLTVDQIQEATSDALDVGLLRYSDGSHIGTGGFIDANARRIEIRHVLAGTDPETLAKVPVGKYNGKTLLMGDVTDIEWGPQGMIGDAVINDGPGLMLIIEKFPWGNTLDVTRGVEAALEEMKPGLPGVEIDTNIFRPANFIETSIENLSNALIIGGALVVIILIAFLYEWRTALISIVAIPLSLLAAGLVLYLSGASLNTMVLAGFVIALGAVVDDAIIGIENVMRRLRQYRESGSTRSTASIIFEATMEVRSPILYATLIVVLAVVPILFMQGLSGAFFKPLVASYIMAILASLVVAITVTPALCLILLNKVSAQDRQSPLISWMSRIYLGVLQKATHAPKGAYITVGVITLVGIFIWPLLGHTLLPSFKERDFLMHWVTNPGTSHQEMVRITQQASKELRSIPGVQNFGAHIGQAFLADEVVGINFGENWISISPDVDYDKTINAVSEVVAGYPGLYRDIQTFLKERVREVLTGSSEAIVVRIFGPELGPLREKAQEVQQAIAKIDGTVHLHTELMVEVPQLQVKVKLDEARRYGLKPGDVRRTLAALIAGNEVGDIFVDGRTYDVQVWTKPELRDSITTISQYLINTPTGKTVRLSEVADIRVAPTPNVIKREGGSRRINVEANVKGRDLASVAEEVQKALNKIDFPLGYYAVLQGEYVELRAARSRILLFALIVIIGIYLLLQLTFKSWRLATLSFLTLPSALVGGILAAYFAGGNVSLGSLVGFLTVLGIAARNGIMMITHFQHLEQVEGVRFGMELVLRGAKERLAPIIMTASTTGLAILPLVIYGDLPGHEIEYPMAVVILGGLITSTLLNLFIVPALYLRFGAEPEGIKLEPVPVVAQA